MAVRGVTVHAVDPFDGWPGYEWVRAAAAVAVDPARAGNDRIVDLALAPRDDDGCVRFDADLRVLRPTGAGNGRLLFVVPNRGLLGGVPFSVGAPAPALGPSEPPHPGDGFLLERGWTIAWCGWQWDLLAGPGSLGLRAPEVDVEPGWLRVEWRPDAAADDHPLSDSSFIFRFADYPTADVDDPDAVLTVRTSPDGERTVVPRSAWRFPDDTHVAVDGGFQPFHWYELVYRTSRCPVVGTGLLAVRDVVSHLRYDGGFDHAFAYGVSQSGRLLRHLLAEGLNVDEDGRPVFDGVLAHIASSRQGEFNHRYAQPSITHSIGFSNLPPFDTTSLLARQRAIGGVPKLLLTNTAWEYWRGDGALVHVDPVTGDDLPDDPDARTYLLAGHDHLGAIPMKEQMPGANPVHRLDGVLVLRALFLALERWAVDGTPPPASAVPRRVDGTLVTREEVLARFEGVPRPDPAVLNVARRVDLGPDAAAGIGRWPVRLGEPYVALVSAVDDTGNEVAGIRVPEVAAPLAAHTGWNPRRPVDGLPDVLYEFLGSRLPVAPRWPDRDAYEAAVRAAAATLVADGFLRRDDVERAVAAAVGLWAFALGRPNANAHNAGTP